MARMIPNGYATQISVVNAYEKLLGQYRFDEISVGQICRSAGIARSTFYYHFKDKYDISQWHYNLIAEKYLFQTGRTLNWFQSNFLNTTAFAQHETLYRWSFDMDGYQSLFSHAKRRRIETLRETIVEYKRQDIDEELEFQIIALADAEVGGVTHWFIAGMPYDVQTLCRYLDDAVPRRLYKLLNTPSDDSFPLLLDTLLSANSPGAVSDLLFDGKQAMQ